jgi:hypothetical protein
VRTLIIVLVISTLSISACTSEGDRAYAEAKKCAALITSGAGCAPQQNQNSNQAPTAQTGNSNSPPAANGDATPPAAGARVETRVYIDASASMQGFVSAPDNSFIKVIEALGYALPGCRLYKYGVSGKQGGGAAAAGATPFAHEIRFSQELRQPSFYNLDFNEDDVLINHLAAENAPVLSVILTDGVYSARNTELQSEVVKAIEKWLRKDGFLGILIFNSSFDGKLYSENSRAWTEKVNVSARPFYAFIFSPDEKSFRELSGRLGAEVKVSGSLVFPREAISCAISPEDKNGLEHKIVPPAQPFFLHMYGESIFNENNQAELSYDVRCTPSPDYPVTGFDLEPVLASYSWSQDTFRKDEKPARFDYKYAAEGAPGDSPTPSAEASKNGTPTPAPTAPRRQPNLKLLLNRDNVARYSFYHLTFNLSGKALNPSVRNLSTQDDSLTGEAGKTYRFYEFISSLTTMHLQHREAISLPPPVFITVTNK